LIGALSFIIRLLELLNDAIDLLNERPDCVRPNILTGFLSREYFGDLALVLYAVLDEELLAVRQENHVAWILVKLRKLLAKIVDTSTESIYRETLALHSEEPAEKDKICVGVLGATSALGFSSSRYEVRSSVIVKKSETDLFVTTCQGSKDLLNLFRGELTI
jgi:hypothetical protein